MWEIPEQGFSTTPFLPDSLQIEKQKDISFQQSYYNIIYVWEMYFSIIYKKHLNSAEMIRILKRICDCEPV